MRHVAVGGIGSLDAASCPGYRNYTFGQSMEQQIEGLRQLHRMAICSIERRVTK